MKMTIFFRFRSYNQIPLRYPDSNLTSSAAFNRSERFLVTTARIVNVMTTVPVCYPSLLTIKRRAWWEIRICVSVYLVVRSQSIQKWSFSFNCCIISICHRIMYGSWFGTWEPHQSNATIGTFFGLVVTAELTDQLSEPLRFSQQEGSRGICG